MIIYSNFVLYAELQRDGGSSKYHSTEVVEDFWVGGFGTSRLDFDIESRLSGISLCQEVCSLKEPFRL